MAQFLATVLVTAALYTLISAGYVVVYRASRMINLAQGEIMMLGGYFLLTAATVGVPSAPSIILTVILGFGFGFFLYWATIRRLLGQPIIMAIIVTVGLSCLLRAIATVIWTPNYRFVLEVMGLTNHPHSIGGVFLSTFDIATIVVAVAFMVGLFIFLRFSRIGIQSRATAEQPLLASFRGVNVNFIFGLSWGLAAVAAFAAGILYSSNVYLSPDIGLIALKALGVIIVGGMDSLLGVIPGALLVALAEVSVMVYLDPRLAEAAPMILALFVLLIRPWGIFGRPEEIKRV